MSRLKKVLRYTISDRLCRAFDICNTEGRKTKACCIITASLVSSDNAAQFTKDYVIYLPIEDVVSAEIEQKIINEIIRSNTKECEKLKKDINLFKGLV